MDLSDVCIAHPLYIAAILYFVLPRVSLVSYLCGSNMPQNLSSCDGADFEKKFPDLLLASEICQL